MQKEAWDEPGRTLALVADKHCNKVAVSKEEVALTDQSVGVLQVDQLCTSCRQTTGELDEHSKELAELIVQCKVGIGSIPVKLRFCTIQIQEWLMRRSIASCCLMGAEGTNIKIRSSDKVVPWLPAMEVVLVGAQINMLGQGTILEQRLLQHRGSTVQCATN